MDSKELIKKLLKHRIISTAVVERSLPDNVYDDSFKGKFYNVLEFEDILFDFIKVPKDSDEYCRDWHHDQLYLISELVKFDSLEDFNYRCINDEEIDLHLNKFLEEI